MQPLHPAPTAPVLDGTAALLDGRYHLGECIGEGGMAHVYRAEDVWLGRTVAVKLMRGDAGEVGSPSRARSEMMILASLDHPALVKLLDGSVEQGRPNYLVMEFVDGTNLADRIHGGPLRPDSVAQLAVALASALHAVHQAGIVHRDLKPSNILLGRTPGTGDQLEVKLADFGVAHLMDSTRVTTPGMVVGTAAYLAPEQVRGEAIAPPADIYALGLVLLEALTGERAFPNASGVGAVLARLVDSPNVPEWVGPSWARLLNRMTATAPAHRPTALEVAQAAANLPTHIRPNTVSAEPAVTQPSFFLPIDVSPTRQVPAPRVPAVTTARSRKRRPVHARATLLAFAAAAAVLCMTAGVWANTADAAPEVAPRNLHSVINPPSENINSGIASGSGSPETAAVVLQDAGQEQIDVAPAQPQAASATDPKRDNEARKDAERAQREAEQAQRDAQKQQRQNERETAMKHKGG